KLWRYLVRQFTNKNNLIGKKLTYSDLVKGWLKEEAKKKQPSYKTKIGKQFKYNIFIRDFFANEKEKTLSNAIRAWKKVKSFNQYTYPFYKSITNKDYKPSFLEPKPNKKLTHKNRSHI
ncbi:MAG: hypothetical protein KKE11_03730, partial [Gammaproteobacteria bacterium]|nr:hypothetical protein [Gammaproteobacteria bacterium]